MNIKSWFTKNTTGKNDTLNLQIEVLEKYIEYSLLETITRRLSDEIVDRWLKENGEQLKKEILKNKNFADGVYNAIVLKKADKL